MENRYDASSGTGTNMGTTGMGEQAMNTTQDVLQQGKEQAGRVVEQVKDQVKSGITSGKEAAAGQLGTVAEALRQTGQTLQDQDRGQVGEYAVRAADMIEGVSEALRNKDIDQMVRDVEDFARRNPAVFLGSAFVLGFMAARFLKSSGSGRYNGDRYGSEYGSQAYAGYSSGYTDRYETPGYPGRPLRSAYERANEVNADNLPPAVTASGRVRADQYPHQEGTTSGTTTGMSGTTTGTSAASLDHDDEFESEGLTTGSRVE